MSRVRITGGQWRSRLLNVTDAAGLRPTPDRVRETLFNWLGQDLTGWRCLDLFAGSGALGFEAASRGAASVVMVECNPRAFAQLRAHAGSLGADRVELIRGDALKFAASAPGPFDLVMLDPPYHKGWLDRLTPWLDALVAPDGRLYVEAEQPLESLSDFVAVRSGRAGQVCFQLMERQQA
ncbi:16S rRNA (guanine(966)-N(2))-methyltransferase RsmD [Nitrogeniibacter mangrovi]|uniref:16S rRNA (Guanine(966)-N(2))-methyltransferase RsmD n=1 Tax=Nitrogeniibacter mangrovi TaxID=2016596 RepID=A0A6C1B976_9RHOO|nr:16S rRNA (guanine(966)-N(2))-methyltransferase RsmD [Nitrogeniibacter mangrovi]QID18890.1 16S rRNA (guanine(966)-N(2))-methyltransferase RsmD [Nitrogeniibacter mangrovi]